MEASAEAEVEFRVTAEVGMAVGAEVEAGIGVTASAEAGRSSGWRRVPRRRQESGWRRAPKPGAQFMTAGGIEVATRFGVTARGEAEAEFGVAVGVTSP
ncbi:hypothetical protein [Streptomyces acidiscabies]|uniref:Uncharacterized protein n=1 Tax=Streptomyces acidiscabies TaxID=42234 RepID=A0AAP6BIT4_9ACTN|nr:hypothetical protein [Streptomyces acidiscabies]MBZ3909673.1 hypothetical protein [Streptomyces acidiscabies]MDX2965365.1 hypothetical protein [Streptomyces acidiscabies]MDX3024566.1 hypothetical protein [Streptomyces acidiscabies]MDX3795199.1 hypothetical protein [Streptomyces acidiscabies]GAV46355.1 hypothetical protein Saa2_09359 [Streptomyces acidiscabies]